MAFCIMLYYSRPGSLTYCFDLRLTAFLRNEERGRIWLSHDARFSGKFTNRRARNRGHRENEAKGPRNLVILLVGPKNEFLSIFLPGSSLQRKQSSSFLATFIHDFKVNISVYIEIEVGK